MLEKDFSFFIFKKLHFYFDIANDIANQHSLVCLPIHIDSGSSKKEEQQEAISMHVEEKPQEGGEVRAR